jgi:hypothetical protein
MSTLGCKTEPYQENKLGNLSRDRQYISIRDGRTGQPFWISRGCDEPHRNHGGTLRLASGDRC